jgi:hypothetical protein
MKIEFKNPRISLPLRKRQEIRKSNFWLTRPPGALKKMISSHLVMLTGKYVVTPRKNILKLINDVIAALEDNFAAVEDYLKARVNTGAAFVPTF